MLLAHKPVPLPIMSPSTSHRRHPSAPPAVVVHPTKVPGILSVAKPLPPRQPPPHSHSHSSTCHPHRSPKPRHAQPHSRIPPKDDSGKPDVTLTPLLELPSAPLATPLSDKPRGRQSKPPKDKPATRSSSSHGLSRRNNVRQPSPPIHSSQAEGQPSPSQYFTLRNPAANAFDPFIISSDSDSDNPRTPFPRNTSRSKSSPIFAQPPSSKIARRRNATAHAPATPSPTPRPVPVPRGKPTHRNTLSRSAPNPQALPPIEKRRASACCTMDFPVCDDTTDVEDNSPPSTPTREFPSDSIFSLDGPRTAPLLSFANAFPFAHPESTPSRTCHHHHHRTPSEGIFNLSLDDDSSSHSDSSEGLKKLFSFPKHFSSVGHSATRAGKDKAGFFASSVFQNSPSPDELPPPAF